MLSHSVHSHNHNLIIQLPLVLVTEILSLPLCLLHYFNHICLSFGLMVEQNNTFEELFHYHYIS